MSADDLVLGGKTQFSGKVIFGLSAAGVDNFLGLAITGKKRIKFVMKFDVKFQKIQGSMNPRLGKPLHN